MRTPVLPETIDESADMLTEDIEYFKSDFARVEESESDACGRIERIGKIRM